jgi:hypothetical protein
MLGQSSVSHSYTYKKNTESTSRIPPALPTLSSYCSNSGLLASSRRSTNLHCKPGSPLSLVSYHCSSDSSCRLTSIQQPARMTCQAPDRYRLISIVNHWSLCKTALFRATRTLVHRKDDTTSPPLLAQASRYRSFGQCATDMLSFFACVRAYNSSERLL